jgi:hypothetical protein
MRMTTEGARQMTWRRVRCAAGAEERVSGGGEARVANEKKGVEGGEREKGRERALRRPFFKGSGSG